MGIQFLFQLVPRSKSYAIHYVIFILPSKKRNTQKLEIKFLIYFLVDHIFVLM